MNKKHARRLALMGKIPPTADNLKKPHTPRTREQKLEREGWVKCGAGFLDPQMWAGVYRAYMLESPHEVSRNSAMPHYPAFSSTPDYWMYGRMMKRSYVYYHVDQDRIEDRGVSYHKTPETKVFCKDNLKWLGDDEVGWWACD